jgi:hypothetical protein
MHGLRSPIFLRILFSAFKPHKPGIFAILLNQAREKVEMPALQRRARKIQKIRTPSSEVDPTRSIKLYFSKRSLCW